LGDGQLEMFAKVVRIMPPRNGNGKGLGNSVSHEQAVALHFELPFRPEANGNGHPKERERRGSPRRVLALPVRVRVEHVPWFEEAMTIDVSAHGLRFLSNREYPQGARLRISFEPTSLTPWPTTGETATRVTRVEPLPETSALAVAVVREL
jgi:hypothetical protein